MDKKSISRILKLMIVVLGLTGAMCCCLMPTIVRYILPGWSAQTQKIWLCVFITAAIPCFACLVPCWLIAGNIGRDKSFSLPNVKYTRLIGLFTGLDTLFLLTSNLITFAFGRSFPAFFAAFYFVIALFFGLTVVALSLSALLKNAAALQNQSDFTI